MATKIKEQGGIPIIMPLIDFRPATLTNVEKKMLTQLEQVDWLIFTSANGIHYFFKALKNLHIQLNNNIKIAVVGTKTEAALHNMGYHPTLLPKAFSAEGIVEAFQGRKVYNQSFIYVKGNLARDVISTELTKLGASIQELTVYETYCPTKQDDILRLLHDKIDAITFTSPSTVRHFVQLLEGREWRNWLNDSVVCCIGPITEKAARDAGMFPAIVPSTYTMTHLMNELSSYFQKEGESDDLF
nr:uroporphyrinogen-III synthase [Bacillus pinisoli]